MPSVASCVLIAWGLVAAFRYLRWSPAWAIASGLIVCAILAARTMTYARVWNDDLSFWKEVVASGSPSALANTQLASALMDVGDFESAERTLKSALTLPGTTTQQAMAYGNLGVIYRRKGSLDEALESFAASARHAPHPVTYHGLGLTLMAQAQQAQSRRDGRAVEDSVVRARAALETALELGKSASEGVYLEQWDPAKTHVLLGQVLNALGERSAARNQFQAALALQPSESVANVARQQLEASGP
jgi:tetratricopeptide (TPR) repeat protein